jgi:hypothetical protein
MRYKLSELLPQDNEKPVAQLRRRQRLGIEAKIALFSSGSDKALADRMEAAILAALIDGEKS